MSANEKDADGRHVCTKEDPWTPAKSDRAVHPDASTFGDGCYEGCCDDYRCPNCGVEWRKEHPQ